MNKQEKVLAKKLYRVFEMLRDSDQFAQSGTSKTLKEKDAEFFLKRAEEEFGELEGCVDGVHRHSDDFTADFLLESSQVFYWLALSSVVKKKSFKDFLEERAGDLARLEKFHADNEIPYLGIFEKDLKECEEKGYI